MEKISTILIAFNEARNIERCLTSVQSFSDEIIVVDSFSSDETATLARKYTSQVYQQQWLGYAGQKKFALEKTGLPWVFWIDADEEVSGNLQKEIRSLSFDVDGYRIARTTRYLNRWIRHGCWNPDTVLRLFRKDRGGFTDAVVHEQFRLQGVSRLLNGTLYHYSYRDIAHHLSKMNSFTTLAAQNMQQRGKRASFSALLLRPAFHFVKGYLLRRGFLDATPGLIVALLDSYYVFLKYAKLWELQRQGPSSAADDRQ
jgi:glycosyltransferase involved in cell wall biosynthesis